ncbi:hypothetical protein [Cohnella terricola]|nr:hypothetical protein [Cohnella terricola]
MVLTVRETVTLPANEVLVFVTVWETDNRPAAVDYDGTTYYVRLVRQKEG